MIQRRKLLKLAVSSAGLLSFPACLTGFSAKAPKNAFSEDHGSFENRVVLSQDHDALQLSMSYNKAVQITPLKRYMCQTSEDIEQVVKHFISVKQAFSVRSGGHCFANLSQHPEAVIDVRLLKDISIDEDRAWVALGAGVTLYEAYKALAPKNLTLPGGTHPNVGISGITLGGGVGYLSRQSGLLCDRLQAIELINANGDLITASRSENEDLFWASKGGAGGNFGIATKFVFEAVRTSTQHAIYITDVVAPERMAAILELWPQWSQNAPRHTTTHLDFSVYPNGNFLVILSGISAEPSRERLLLQLQYLMQTPKPIHPNYLTTGNMEAMIPILYKLHEYISETTVGRSDYAVEGIPPKGAADIVTAMLRHPPGAIKIVQEPMRGAVADIASDATAYPHRQAGFLIQYLAEYIRPDEQASRQNAMDDVAKAYAPHTTGGAYVNYADPKLENWQQAYWGENLDRLKKIKRKYDPDNVFNHAQSIPLE